MNTLKLIGNFIGYGILFLVAIQTFAMWGEIYGGIGFFGSIMTFPISSVLALFIMVFSNTGGFLLDCFLLVIAMALIVNN